MLERISAERSLMAQDFAFLGAAPMVLHCHHFNLFWDQTIDDALGTSLGIAVRTRAAREAYYELLSGLAESMALDPGEDRLALARTLFSATGQGRLTLPDEPGGQALGEYLHYAHAWNEKYSKKLRRKHPADAVAAGFVAAALEVAFDLPRETLQVDETGCMVLRDDVCRFEIKSGPESPLFPPVRRSDFEANAKPSFGGHYEGEIQQIATGLRNFAGTMHGDQRGLMQAFGLYVTEHPSTYYNRAGYDAYNQLARTAPQSLPVMKALLREAGHVCVFNTFGNILLSPEWEGLVGPLSGNIEETILDCAAIARALGFGHWTIHELRPNERLVMRSPGTYESMYYAQREGRARESTCFVFQGAGIAIMQLAHRVPWTSRPQLTAEFYGELFRGGLPWRVEETSCVARGDAFCEAVVTRERR